MLCLSEPNSMVRISAGLSRDAFVMCATGSGSPTSWPPLLQTVVFHAAALKHVPHLEREVSEAVRTNVFGTVNAADAAVSSGAEAFVLISTDKATHPTSILGATKRLAELYSNRSAALPVRSWRRAANAACRGPVWQCCWHSGVGDPPLP